MEPALDALYQQIFAEKGFDIKALVRPSDSRLVQVKLQPGHEATTFAGLTERTVFDRMLHQDVRIQLSCDQAFTIQEKMLAPRYRSHDTVTMEYYDEVGIPGDWFDCRADLYVAGWRKEDFTVDVWIIMVRLAIVLETELGVMVWSEPRENSKSAATANFRWIRRADIPDSVIFAQGWPV